MAPLWLRRLCLLLLLCMTVVSQTRSKRRKREWILPATKLIENVDYTKKEFIAKIWSDKHTEDKPVEYSLTGHGADREPYNLFVVNPQNGWVRITRILDREERSEYNLKGQARYRNGSLAEGEVLLKIQVTDQNDNPPKFTFSEGSVTECSQIGTPVMKITAEDADEPGTINTKIAYSIVKQKPDGAGPMFSINRDTGDIYVKEHTLDRETHDSYTLIVQGVDMDGAPGGKTGTGTVEIKVLDINDNAPTLEQDEHINHVDEDVDDVVVMRLKALDKDLEYTDNWRVLFKIIEGNEDGHFTIETDPNTNEGILKLVKPVDYEVVKEMNLDLVVSNVAPFINGTATSMDSERNLGGNGAGAGDAGGGGQAGAGAGAGGGGGGGGNGTGLGEGGGGAGAEGGGPAAEGKRYRVKVMVNNLSDGLAFSPSEKTFPVSEDPKKIQVPKIIGSFPAVDGDTGKPAENVRYAKGYDPDNWLSIDEDTSEIKLVKIPDRESKFLVNGTYYAKILCMTEDVPPKTITGTIALKVEDANDHCPRLTSNYESICSDTKIVNVTALDQDIYPNAEPYKFVLVKEETRGEWEMVPVNGTTVSFHAKDELWPGLYELTVEITDMQGLGCEDKQKLEVEVCTCEEGNTCVVAPRASQQRVSSVNMGAPAIGLLIAGLALLMLIPMLLLFCQCGALSDFTELSLDAKENLLSYHTEGKGEDKEVPLLSAPVQRPMAASATFGSKVPTMPSPQAHEQVMQTDSMLVYQNNTFSANHHRSDLYASSFRPGKHDMYGGIALPDHFLHGYFAQKAKCAAENPPLKDSLLVYSHEGQDSPVGSLDCCSLLDSGSDMTFLNDLGPKFIALAEICCPPKPSPPPPKAEQIVQTVDTTIKNESCASASIVPLSEPVPSLPQQSNVDTKALNSSDTLSSMNISQIQLVQQQQPLYYLVDHQVPSTVIIAERPMQGTYLINGSAETGGLILQDSNTAQASLNGVYLIRETSVLQDNYLIDSLSNPSSPGSPTSPSFLVQGNCLQHHDSISQITVPGMQRMVLLQSAGNVVPAVLSQTPSIGPKHPGEVGNRLDPQRSPSQDSSRNVFMHQQETMSFNTMSQPEEAQAQLNTKADTEQFSKQVHTDYTSDEAQMTIPPHMKVMHPILSDLPLQKSTTADILAKANAIRKELEETMLNQGFNKQVSPTRQENKSTDDTIKTANLSTTCQEDKKEVQESECQGSENEANLPGKDPSVSPDGPGQKEKVGVIMEEINSDDPEEIICEQSLIQQVEDEEEIVSSQLKMEDLPVIETQVETLAAELNNGSDQDLAGASDVTLETPQDISGLEVDTEAGLVNDYQVTLLTKEEDLKPEPGQQNLEEVKLAGSDSEREDAEVKSRIQMTEDMTVMEEVDLNDDSEQENLVELLDVNQKVPQGVTEEVATGVVPDFQVALPPEVVKEELNPELQIMEEVKKNEHGPSQINMSVKFDLTDTALKSEDVGDQLGSSIQKIKDIPVMEHMQITDVEVNDQLHQELVETGSDLQDPTYLRQSAPVDPESDEEADLEEAISSLSQSCTQTELEQRIAMRQYIEALEVDTETPVQVPTGQMKPEGIRNISIQNESLTLRQSPELRKTTEKNYYYYFDKESANNVPDCQILPADLMFQEDVDSSEDISAEEVDAQMTANTPIKTREYHPEIQILGEEEGISQAECCDPSQSAFTNLKSVSGGLEDEIHLILPQAEMAETKACAALPEEDDLTEIDAEKASDVSSEVMEQVSPTASNTSESEAAGLQMKSEEDATVSPKIKHRNSKSSKKVTSPKSPARHCKSQ